MSDFQPLPAHQAERLGQLVHATLAGVPDVALSEGNMTAAPTWAQLANLRKAAQSAPAPAPEADTALSVPEPSGPTPGSVEWQAAQIEASRTVREFRARYGDNPEDVAAKMFAENYLHQYGLDR